MVCTQGGVLVGCGIRGRWIEVCGVLCCDVLWSSESSVDSAVTCTHATYLGFVSSVKEFIWYQPLTVPECT